LVPVTSERFDSSHLWGSEREDLIHAGPQQSNLPFKKGRAPLDLTELEPAGHGLSAGRDKVGASVNSQREEVILVGHVESPITDRTQAPRQGDEGAPSAWLVFEPEMAEAIRDLRVGDQLIILTWLDRARRDVLSTHPRDDPTRAVVGVFSTRSPDRPNPIGLHRTQVQAIDRLRVLASNLEVLNGTPIIDVKPVLDPVSER
jgi:tRNA-Thr(GGU) m(6)t(6)A37 methyltransferase TsaA